VRTFGATLAGDIGYALRLLRRAPGFAALAIATLALGVGGTTAIFTVVDAVLLRPLKFPQPSELAMIRWSSGARVSPGDLHEWRAASHDFADLAGWQDERANLTGPGSPLEVQVDRATTNFFQLLGTSALLGRAFTTSSDLSIAEPEVVLSHGFWQRHFAGDPHVVGRRLTLDGETFTVIGVMPAGFVIRTNELAESRAEAWLPLRLTPDFLRDGGGFLNLVGRLRPGVTAEHGQAELAAIAKRIEARHPLPSPQWRIEVTSLLAATVKDVRLTLLVLLGAVGILLLIACANVANLVLSRAAARETELAIRFSLGASAGRVFRQLLTESLVLATFGGATGAVLAAWGIHLFVAAIPPGLELPRTGEIAVNLRVLAVVSIAVVVVAILVGLVPWIGTVRSTARPALREDTRGSTAGRRRHALGGALVVLEVALALTLLAAGGLLTRSFLQLSRVNPGFHAEHVLTVRTTLPQARYDTPDRIRAFASAFSERVRALPGAEAVGFADYLPMSNFGRGASFSIEGRPKAANGEGPGSWVSVVGGDYFSAMGIPLVRGRLFSDADTARTPPVFVIDEELARRYWPGENALGRRITWRQGADDAPVTGEIVGIVGSVRWGGMAVSPVATTYWWFPQQPGRQLTVVTRTSAGASTLATAIAREVNGIDPGQPVADVRAMQDFVSDDLLRPRFTTEIVAGFAGVALLLSAIGLYGVMAFAVTQRTREIGVRMALGADRRRVVALILRRAVLLTGLGLAIGLATALALGRVMAGLVFGVATDDPFTFVTVSLFLAGVAFCASYIPARQAASVDPVVALRSE
jgi:predicted permease